MEESVDLSFNKVVITGSSRGFGYALAREFLRAHDAVIVSCRHQDHVERTVNKLKREVPNAMVHGVHCDVTNREEVEVLVRFARLTFGEINLWINNAGTDSYTRTPFAEMLTGQITEIVETNLLGTIYGTKAALQYMIPQGHGHIVNVVGWGAAGGPTARLAVYGATKAAIAQLTRTVAEETDGTGVGLHTLNPGMVVTDLLTKGTTDQDKRVFNILADRPETVAQYFLPLLRKLKGTGTRLKYLTKARKQYRFHTARERKGRFFDEGED